MNRKTDQDHITSPRTRLLKAGTEVFAERGYGGGSVREICDRAGTSSNMIHHYFGSKRGLYDEILSLFSEQVFVVPLRIINGSPNSREALIARLEIFAEETLEALIANQDIYRMVTREEVIFPVFEHYSEQFISFLETVKEKGLVRPDIDASMLTGMLLDRLGNQIQYSSWIKKTHGTSILEDRDYRKRWLRANLDFFLNGILSS